MNSKTVSLLFTLLCTSALHAVDVRFLAFDNKVTSQKVLVVTGAKDDHSELIGDLAELKRSKNYKSTENAPVKLMIEGKKDANGNPLTCEVPLKSATKPLVIIIATDKTPSGLAGVAVDDNESNFKWGSVLAFNSCKEDMALVFVPQGKPKVMAKIPAGWTPTTIMPPVEKGAFGMQLFKASDLKSVMFSNVWTSDPGTRELVFVMPSEDKRLGPVFPKVITETRETLRAEEEAERARRGAASNPPPGDHH